MNEAPQAVDPAVVALENLAERLQGFGADVHAEFIDGYLTALAAGPVLPDIAEWRPLMLGEAFDRAFADPPDVAAAERVLLNRLAVVRRQLDADALLDEPDRLRLEPLLYRWDGAPEAAFEALPEEDRPFARALEQGGALWAEGFMIGVDSLPHIWRRPDDPEAAALLEELVGAVAALMQPTPQAGAGEEVDGADADGEVGEADGDEDTITPREAAIDQALFAIQDLRVFWLDHAPRPETRRVAPQPGRNDPCPCGSGKKFKKCHGAAA
jgi:uncharacterized protein